MRVDLFDFELPQDLIAQRPAVPRDSARLLEVRPDSLRDRSIAALPELLRPGDLMIFNDTRVLPARLRGQRPAGAGRGDVAVEVLLLRRLQDGNWSAMARPARRLRSGDRLQFGGELAASVIERHQDGTLSLAFELGEAALAVQLARHGAMPLPPYIRGGSADDRDRSDYQTMYARSDGAVAAPTAGLHFTPDLLERLQARGIETAMLTLHVGSGTFQPVRVDDTDLHRMAFEWGEISGETATRIERCRSTGGRIVAVGTTSLRLLESVALRCEGRIVPWSGDTDLFVVPGFRFRVVDLLLTNFHLPRSTLFMLVSAFAGIERMRTAYDHAIAARYRFYSYGDACLLQRAAPA